MQTGDTEVTNETNPTHLIIHVVAGQPGTKATKTVVHEETSLKLARKWVKENFRKLVREGDALLVCLIQDEEVAVPGALVLTTKTRPAPAPEPVEPPAAPPALTGDADPFQPLVNPPNDAE
jgi:hypothetical protein